MPIFQPIPSLVSTMNQSAGDEIRRTMGIANVLNQIQNTRLNQQLAMQRAEALQREQALREFLTSKAAQGQVPSMAEVLPYSPELGVQLGNQERQREQTAILDAQRRDIAAMTDQQRRDALQARYDQARQLQQERFDQQEHMLRLAKSMRQGPQPPAPVAIVGPDGQPVLVPPAEAYGKRPWKEAKGPDAPVKPLPPGLAKAYIENNNALAKVDRAEQTLAKSRDATGVHGVLPDIALQRIDPAGVDARAAIADIGSLVIHDRSGAAVTAAEFPRLRPFIPNVTDTPEVVKKKLANFKREYQTVQREIEEYADLQGYKSPRAPGRGASGSFDAPVAGPARISSDAEYDALPSGATYIAPDGKTRTKR